MLLLRAYQRKLPASIPDFNLPRIRLYFESEIKTNNKGPIVWQYPLTDVYSAHAVLLPDVGDGHTEYRGVKAPLKRKRVIIAHTTSNRLGMYVMGQAIFSAKLLKREAIDVCSTILCKANDEILYPMLNGFPHIKKGGTHRALQRQ